MKTLKLSKVCAEMLKKVNGMNSDVELLTELKDEFMFMHLGTVEDARIKAGTLYELKALSNRISRFIASLEGVQGKDKKNPAGRAGRVETKLKSRAKV